MAGVAFGPRPPAAVELALASLRLGCTVVVPTLTHRYSAVRGHKTAVSSNSLEWKITSGGKKKEKRIHS